MDQKIIQYNNRQKALDHAVWLNFSHRINKLRYGVVQSFEGGYFVIPTNHPTFEKQDYEVLPTDYSALSFKEIKAIGMDTEPLSHWEKIQGMVSTIHGEILRFLIAMKIPFERFILWELANRGHDENHQWVGFEKAAEIWLK